MDAESIARARVVKVGGSRLRDEEFTHRLAAHVAVLARNTRVVVVHGGGPQIGALHEALGVDYEKNRGLRVTREESMPLVSMALAHVNESLVSALGAAGVRCLGLRGVDARLMRSDLLDLRRLGRVGHAPTVRGETLRRLLDEVPVIVLSPICLGPDHRPVNVNADDVAQAVAGALRCSVFDLMTDVDGVRADDGRVLRTIDPARVEELVLDGTARGGMIPKLRAARAAISAGVGRVRIGTLESMVGGTCTQVERGRHLRLVSA